MNAELGFSYLGNELGSFEEAWHRHFHHLIFEGSRLPLRTVLPLLSGKRARPSAGFIRRIRDDLDSLIEQDIANVKAGYYPKAALGFPLISYIYSAMTSGPLDGLRVIHRAKNNNWKELPSHAKKRIYPDYYLRTFHWQTDGWFSEKSAKRYDVSVQFLFGGVADVMRRMAIPPIARLLSNNADVKILDLACGTGSFIPMMRLAFPNAKLYGVDLSPDYLRYACKKFKGDNVFYRNENAENLSFRDGTLDAVVCNNLFHELPPLVRRRVFSEVFRVLKRGGIFSVTDSVQVGDNPNMNESIEYFSKRFHEPFHRHYIEDDLRNIFLEGGFGEGGSTTNLFSKSIYGLKP